MNVTQWHVSDDSDVTARATENREGKITGDKIGWPLSWKHGKCPGQRDFWDFRMVSGADSLIDKLT